MMTYVSVLDTNTLWYYVSMVHPGVGSLNISPMEILNDGVTTGMVWYQWWHPSRLIYISFQGISDKYQGKYSRSDNLG